MRCVEEVLKDNKACENCDCRKWIDFPEDNNCCLISVKKHGRLTLQQVGKRLGVSYVRIKQIEDKAKEKLIKKAKSELSKVSD
tara:strand:- start:457 stop:705 length:249 start_codon:yes stop_codon:yes gene_type:complete